VVLVLELDSKSLTVKRWNKQVFKESFIDLAQIYTIFFLSGRYKVYNEKYDEKHSR
jgi:hypothetical protein